MKKVPISSTAGGPSKGIVPSKHVPGPLVPQTEAPVGVVRAVGGHGHPGGGTGTGTGTGTSTGAGTGTGTGTGARHRKVLQEAADLNAKFTSSVKLTAPQTGALDATAGAGAGAGAALALLGDPTGAANDYEAAKVKARVKKSSELDDERRSVMDLDRWESVLNHGTNGAAAGGADDDWD